MAGDAGKVALITGATDGIGKATARRLAVDGWTVVIVGRREVRCAEVVAELRGLSGGGAVSAIVADLTVMADVRAAAEAFLAAHARLDLLLLNANAITQDRQLTVEGFEANLAVGHLGRALLAVLLEPCVAAARGQLLWVVGLDHERLDLADPQLARGYTARRALTRWQWAAQVFVRMWNAQGKPAANVLMPGLVRTKILSNEPQPMRVFVQLMNLIIGLSPERSADEVAAVVADVAAHDRRDTFFWRSKPAKPRDLKTTPTDGPAVWAWTLSALAPWLR